MFHHQFDKLWRVYGLCLSAAPYIFIVILMRKSYRWLIFEGMKLSIKKKHGLWFILMSMREGVVALSEVETKDNQSKGSNQLLLEGDLS